MARLMLRLGTQCNSACAHCTLLDIPTDRARAPKDALAEIVEARRRGCTELVIMRGEPTLHPELPALARAARRIGFRLIQIQTNGRRLCYPEYLDHLIDAGIDFFEVALFGGTAETHDAISVDGGAFEQTVAGLENIARLKERGILHVGHLVTIAVLRRNLDELTSAVELVADLGLRRVQLNFTRPIVVAGEWKTDLLASLDEAGPSIRAALATAHARGLAASTEAVPLCHLAPADRPGAERSADFQDVRVADLHLSHERFAVQHDAQRPKPADCERCALFGTCASTWAAYLERFGAHELRPLARPDSPVPTETAD